MLTASDKAAVQRWARGQRLAARRIARDAEKPRSLQRDLERVDELRALADTLGASVDRERASAENLAFHSTWAELRRAMGFG